MIKPNPDAADSFDGFEADDDFAPPSLEPWRTADALAPAAAEDEPFEPLELDTPPGALAGFGADAPFAAAPAIDAFEPEEAADLGAPAPMAGAAAASAAAPPGMDISPDLQGGLSAPRIGIHIFCERPDTAAAGEQAAKDRRMTRATTMVRAGGLASAVEYYQNQPTPPLVIVECLSPGQVIIGLLDQLAEVCDTGTKVVVIGDHNDIALYRELMRRGVSEYLVAPLNALQLIHAVTSLYADPSAAFIGRQIAFVGARGGVGSSTIAHNLAFLLAEYIQSGTVIADFDLPFGTAGLDFNQDPLQGVADALSQPDRLDAVLLERMMVRCNDRLSLFAAPATLDSDYDIGADAFEEVATKIRTTAPFVILDLPHLWSSWLRRLVLGADEVVITAAPDLASLRNAKNIVDLLRQARPNDQPPRLVLNQMGMPGRPEIPAKDFTAALGVEAPAIVPFDAKLFGQAANNGQMVAEVASKSKSVEVLQGLARAIARREAAPVAKKSSLSGLFKLK